jgi:hypothetical protein
MTGLIGSEIIGDDKDAIRALNECLFIQTGDFEEFRAMINDTKDIGYTINWSTISNLAFAAAKTNRRLTTKVSPRSF